MWSGENISIISKRNLYHLQSFLIPYYSHPLETTSTHSIFHINGITQCAVLCHVLLSGNVIFLRFNHVIACINTSGLLFAKKRHSMVRTDHILFIYSSLDEHFRCLGFLALIINGAMNVRAQVSPPTCF